MNLNEDDVDDASSDSSGTTTRDFGLEDFFCYNGVEPWAVESVKSIRDVQTTSEEQRTVSASVTHPR